MFGHSFNVRQLFIAGLWCVLALSIFAGSCFVWRFHRDGLLPLCALLSTIVGVPLCLGRCAGTLLGPRAGLGASLAVIGVGIEWLFEINPGTVAATGSVVAGSFVLGQCAPAGCERIDALGRVRYAAMFALFAGALGAVLFGADRAVLCGMCAIASGAYLLGQSIKGG